MDRIVIMGVQGTGKTTIGRALAATLGRPFVDGDALHPPANVAKMAGGVPLDDVDRMPWLHEVARTLATAEAPVVACSALKRSYRDLVRDGAPGTRFVHLVGDRAVLAERLADRDHAYMPATLLDSQLATLEPLGADEAGVALSILAAPERIVADARAWLATSTPGVRSRAPGPDGTRLDAHSRRVRADDGMDLDDVKEHRP